MTGMQLLTDRARTHRVSRDEFESLRDDPLDRSRYELLNGEVLVTPSPVLNHQRVVGRLSAALNAVVPGDHEVIPSPFDVLLHGADDDTILQPDLLFADRARLTEKHHDGPPVLVVEVLSPTTWQRDLGDKMAAYAHAGVRHYWVVAPKVPSITIYQLTDEGEYAERAHVEGRQPIHVTEPVELTLRPADLVS